MLAPTQGHEPSALQVPLGVQNPPALLQAPTLLPALSFLNSKQRLPPTRRGSEIQHDPLVG